MTDFQSKLELSEHLEKTNEKKFIDFIEKESKPRVAENLFSLKGCERPEPVNKTSLVVKNAYE